MTNSIKDILGGSKFSEPEEIRIIKNFVFENYQSDCTVTMKPKVIVINVSSGALAGTLRTRLLELHKLCKTDKRLSVRIG